MFRGPGGGAESAQACSERLAVATANAAKLRTISIDGCIVRDFFVGVERNTDESAEFGFGMACKIRTCGLGGGRHHMHVPATKGSPNGFNMRCLHISRLLISGSWLFAFAHIKHQLVD
jgi:hypothetical protein